MIYKKIHIIIPVYNEGENIIRTLDEIERQVKTPHDIRIIYDFDEDNTLPVIKDLAAQKDLSVVKNVYGRGVLNAIKTGFDSVDEGVLLLLMADLSDDLANVDKMFEMVNSGYDLVCGSRYMQGGSQIGGPLLKRMLSRAAGVSLHYLARLPTHDVTNSFKMYTRNALDRIRIESDGGFEVGMEVVVKTHFAGLKVGEVPCTWRDRTEGESRFKIRQWLPKYLKWYFYAVNHSARSLFVRPRTL